MFPNKRTPALAGLMILLLCSSGIAVAKDKVLPEELAAETTARMAADSALQANIDAEEVARVANDAALQSDIDANSTRIDNTEDAVSTLDSTMLYVVRDDTTLPPGPPPLFGIANTLAPCDEGDIVVGGACKYHTFPIAGQISSFTTKEGTWENGQFEIIESWNCQLSNHLGTTTVFIRTTSICMHVPPE